MFRRIEYLIPVIPRAAPTTQVQIIFASEPAANAITPAAIHAIVPAEINMTTDEIFERPCFFIVASHPESLDSFLQVQPRQQ